MGIGSVAVYSEADRDAPHVAQGRRGSPDRPAGARRELPERRAAARGGEQGGRPGDPPRLRVPRRERRVRRRLRRGGDHVHRPPGERDRGDGLEDARAGADGGRRRADRAGHHRPRGERRGRAEEAKEIGYPVACKAAGGGGGKGFRVANSEDDLEEAFEGAAREGEKFFSDPTRLPRALPRGPAPRRGPGAGRFARQRRAPRRAGLLDPAPPPEADRGGARASRRRRDARADRRDRHRRRRRGRLPRRRGRSRACRTARTTSSSR